jgi:hypothetical protein
MYHNSIWKENTLHLQQILPEFLLAVSVRNFRKL